MINQLEALIAAAKNYSETLNAHRENPKDAEMVEAWDKASSELDSLIKNNELDIVASLIAALEQKDKYIAELRDANFGLAQESCEQQMHIAAIEASQLAVKLPDLNEHLIAILGRPNFTCCHLAELLRRTGVEIRRKSENEQAAVIHYLLNFYLEYGDKWESIAQEDIQLKVAKQTASCAVQGGE